MKVLLTGADGFLGWHTRTRLFTHGTHEVVAVGLPEWPHLAQHAAGVDAVIHLAGINDHANEAGNVELAEHLSAALGDTDPPPRIVFSNTIHADADTPYGRGKRRAAELLADTAAERGGSFVDVRLPNLFGEHARPNYNTFTATFIEAILTGRTPRITDREIGLLHAQDAARALIEAAEAEMPPGERAMTSPTPTMTSVRAVYDTLARQHAVYSAAGEIPAIGSQLELNLFNSLRAAMFPRNMPIRFTQHTDPRGSFVELVRLRGGGGQTSFSTTKPGITRGDHFHLRKIERFVVLDGRARISLRRAFHDEVLDFDVSGTEPCAIDMPIGWSHSITNTGDTTLTTLFWISEPYDAADPDTFPMKVTPEGSTVASQNAPLVTSGIREI